MKRLVYSNSDSSIITEYLVDVIGSSDLLTIYQIGQIIDGEATVVNGTGGTTDMNSTLVGLNFPNMVKEWTLVEAIALAVSVNYTLKVYEYGKDVVTLNTLS